MITLPSLQFNASGHVPTDDLSVGDILHVFGNVPAEGACPVDALRAALAAPEQMTPALLALLDQSPDRILEIQDEHLQRDVEYYTHIFAMFLLAAYGETRAFASILRFFHRHAETDGPLSGERAHYVVGDLVTMDLPLILAATYDGDCGPLLDMICDHECNECVGFGLELLAGSNEVGLALELDDPSNVAIDE